MSTTFTHTRLIPAPPDAVYAAFADPARLACWWGPNGFTNTFQRFEFHPGGRWTLTMHGPDGKDYPNESEFTVVELNCRIIVRHISPPNFELCINLQEQGDGTRVTWVQTFADDMLAQSLRPIVEPANEQNLQRWEAELGL